MAEYVWRIYFRVKGKEVQPEKQISPTIYFLSWNDITFPFVQDIVRVISIIIILIVSKISFSRSQLQTSCALLGGGTQAKMVSLISISV